MLDSIRFMAVGIDHFHIGAETKRRPLSITQGASNCVVAGARSDRLHMGLHRVVLRMHFEG